MKFTSRFLLLPIAALLTNPAAAGSNIITVSWAPLPPAVVPTLGTYATIAMGILLAIIAFRVIKARPGAATYLVVAALSLTALATAVVIPKVIASAPVTVPPDSGCGAGSATYPATDSSVQFENLCNVVLKIQLNFDDAPCNESQAAIACGPTKNCKYSGDLIKPQGEEPTPFLAHCAR